MGQRIFRTLHQVKQEDIFVLISGVQLVFYEYLKDSILNLLAPGEDLSLLKFSPFSPPTSCFLPVISGCLSAESPQNVSSLGS